MRINNMAADEVKGQSVVLKDLTKVTIQLTITINNKSVVFII